MPSCTSLPLSLSDILETRGGPLRELEIWAVLCQGAEALQDLILRGETGACDEHIRYIITPNSLLVRNSGTIYLAEVTQDLRGSLYTAPELELNIGQPLTDTAIEKICAYSLGRTLQVASEFGLKENEVLSISYDLNSLLQAMSEKNAAVRLSLMHILEACALQASQHPLRPPHCQTIMRLYKTILSGNTEDTFKDSSYGSDNSQQSMFVAHPGRVRRPRPQVRHRHDSTQFKSRSKSRSRSRSRSRSVSQRGLDSCFLPSGHQTPSLPHKGSGIGREAFGKEHGTMGCTDTRTVDTIPLDSHSLINITSKHNELLDLDQFSRAPTSSAASRCVQGLLGSRQGSPAYQKYIQLKERQIRLNRARLGQRNVLSHSHMVSPTLLSVENLETHSMASLMSYTLGAYKPHLHTHVGSGAALDFSKDTETDTGSHMSVMFSSDQHSPVLRSEKTPEFQASSESGSQQLQVERLAQQQIHQTGLPNPQKTEKRTEQIFGTEKMEPYAELTDPLVERKREIAGPEFIYKNQKAVILLSMASVGNREKSAALFQRLTIVHLTGQRFEIFVNPGATGRQIFDTVIPCLDLDDFFFFGLTYVAEGEHFFLEPDTKLYKVAPEGWKYGPKGSAPAVKFTLYLRVKFYPESLTDFRHTSSYHLLYLQLRSDILEERVTCDSDTLATLAGLALQVEHGDHITMSKKENYFLGEHYFPKSAVKKFGSADVYSSAVKQHKLYGGISSSQAEIEYIKLVRHLPEYGYHFHKLFKAKSHFDNYIWIGLSQRSLVLAEPEVSGRIIIQDYPWNFVLKISFNKRRFSIQPKMEAVNGKQPKMNFFTSSYRKGRYLLQFSTEQHRFQIRMRTRPSNLETLAADLSTEISTQTADAIDHAALEEDVAEDFALLPVYKDPSQQALPEETDDELFSDGLVDVCSVQPFQYCSPPCYEPPHIAQILGCVHVYPEPEDVQLHADLTSMAFDYEQLQTLLDLSPPSSSSLFTPSESQIGRHVFEVMLEKEGNHSIGLTIVGGETTGSLDLGIFVKSLAPGGPAERDGRIMPGDRLIAINGTSLEGMQHHEAVGIIRDGGQQVRLLVSQIRPPGTIKKRGIKEQQEEFDKKLRSSVLQYKSKNVVNDEANSSSSEVSYIFDHSVLSNNVLKCIDSNHVCNSDEEQDPLPISTTFSHLDSLSSLLKSAQHQKAHGDCDHDLSLNTLTPANALKSTVQERQDPTYENQAGRYFTMVPFMSYEEDHHKQSLDRDDRNYSKSEEETFLKLSEYQELSYPMHRQALAWPNSVASVSSLKSHQEGLTEKDKKDLQILGDIAALDADESSSDSDFDSAVKKTIDKSSHQVRPNSPFATSATVVDPACRGVSEMANLAPASKVIYEVILERKVDSGSGIITEEQDDPDFPKYGVCIKEILGNSPAKQGGILAPGDRILEVAGQSVEGKSSKTVQDLLDSVSDFSTLKISRSIQMDENMIGTLDIGYKATDLSQHLYQAQQGRQIGSHYFQHMPLSDSALCSHDLKAQSNRMSSSVVIPFAPKDKKESLNMSPYMLPPNASVRCLDLPDSESNTQSDVDSDVLDSSRWDPESTCFKAENTLYSDPVSSLRFGPDDINGNDLALRTAAHGKKPQGKLHESNSDECDCLKANHAGQEKKEKEDDILNTSSEFSEQLLALKTIIDKQIEIDNDTPTTIFKFVRSTSTDVMRPSEQSVRDGHSSLKGDVTIETSYDPQDFKCKAEDDGDVTIYGEEPADQNLSEEAYNCKQDNWKNVFIDRGNIFAKQGSEEDANIKYEILEVSLKKKRQTGFGFTVAGGASTGGCYVKQLVSEPATTDGRILPGDLLLKVNGQDTTSMNHVEAVTLLRKIPDVARLILLRYLTSSDALGKMHLAEVRSGVMRIELQRANSSQTSLGISLVQREVEGQTAIYVERLETGSIAYQDGRLMAGDQILQVNNQSFIGMTKRRALVCLMEAGERVVLTVIRSDRHRRLAKENSVDYCDDSKEISDKASYVSPRTLNMDIPVVISSEWLKFLPLLCMTVDKGSESTIRLLQSLAELVEGGDPTEEFKSLHRNMKELDACDEGKLPENKPKNRYRNVLPYDTNRVRLQNRVNSYINASNISVEVGSVCMKYIACQGPVAQSTSDFWAMVWQEGVAVIVMLTQVTEGGKIKCHLYWPQTKDDVMKINNGKYTVKLVRSYHLEEFAVIQVSMKEMNTQKARRVTILQYTLWPDHGIPDTALPLLKLLQVLHLLERGSPPIIHCSAGIGRTGVLIAVDIALATIEQGLELNLYEIVRSLREQRHGMIQTTDQYLFCYTACMEALLSMDIAS